MSLEVNIGKGLTMTVDPSKFNAEVTAHVMKIGLRNILMDAHASATAKTYPDTYVAKSQHDLPVERWPRALLQSSGHAGIQRPYYHLGNRLMCRGNSTTLVVQMTRWRVIRGIAVDAGRAIGRMGGRL